MSRYCPVAGTKVTYMACLDCDEKECIKERFSADVPEKNEAPAQSVQGEEEK